MFWMREQERLKAEMPQHLKRVVSAFKDHWRTAWVYRAESGKLHTILHDGMNVVVEAGRIDAYFVTHWGLVALLLSNVVTGVIFYG